MALKVEYFVRKFSSVLSDNSLTKKASLNAVAATLDYAARWAIEFILNPLLLRGLGDFGFGAWQVLGRLIGYIAPAGGRPTQALKWTIANQQNSTDFEEKRRQVGNAAAVWVIFLPILSLIGAIVTWYAPFWLDARAEYIWSVRWAAGLLVANLILSNLTNIPQSVLRGENLGHKRMGLTTFFVLLGGAIMALALFLDGGLAGVALANLITTALTGIMFYKVVKSYVSWFGIAKPILREVWNFLGLSGWFLVWNLVMLWLRSSDVVILGILDSAELVPQYSLTRYIPETIIGFVAIVVFSITPGLGGIVGDKDYTKAAKIRSEIMIFTWLVVTVVGSTILIWNRSFIHLWVGEEYFAGSFANLLIILVVSQFIFIRNDANIIDLTLDLKSKVFLGLFSTIVSASIAYVLIRLFNLGIIGLALGFLIGQSILTVGYPLLISRFFKISLSSQIKGIIRPGLVTFVLFSLFSTLGKLLAAENWLLLIISVGSTVAVISPIAIFLGINKEQRIGLWGRVKRAVKST